MKKDIGTKIKNIRNEMHITQGELASKACIAQSTLSYIENGKKAPHFHTLSAICRGLGTTVLELLSYDEEQNDTKLFKEPGDTDVISKNTESLTAENTQDTNNLNDIEKYLFNKYLQEAYE